MCFINNFRNDGGGEAANWEVPIGGKTLNTPLPATSVIRLFKKIKTGQLSPLPL